jgi:outer membrane protein OmpA-like peptidoglycan-associated protein
MIQDGILRLGPDAHPVPVHDALLYNGRIFLAGGLGAGFDAAFYLPIYYESLPGASATPDNGGPGDLSAVMTYGMPFRLPIVSFSLSAIGSAPTSFRHGPRLPQQLAFYPASGSLPDALSHPLGMDAPRAGAGGGISLDFSEALNGPDLQVHANAAADRAMAPGRDNPLGTFSASVAMEAALGKACRLEGEFRHERLVAGPDELGDPLGRSTSLSLGLGAKAWGGLTFRAGARLAPSDWNPYLPLSWRDEAGVERRLAYRPLPAYSASFQIAWQGFPLDRDIDHDGVPDGKDLCPTVPEDRDGFQDEDGCPDPDNDHDGVLDANDACPYVPEDHDGFEDADGCPELDNDHDGIPDKEDKCPNDPEDKDGFEDKDGCPDLDNDQDGIPDALDKCPNEAENRNGIEDEDGCPEVDSDHDGIPDSRDKCPHEAETLNFYQDEDGCPDEKPEPIADAILEGVRFVGNSADLDTASFTALNGLATRLSAYPGTEIEVQGFLDDRAGPRAKALSRERAEAVVEYLATRGIEVQRLKPVGYGSTQPLAPNRTAQGREKNRRIQIHRLN